MLKEARRPPKFWILDFESWILFYHPSGGSGGGGQLSVLYISEESQQSFEQKSTGSKQTQMPQKLIW
jgi:hypothetical protein